MLDDRPIFLEKIDSLKLQLAETQKREEYLRGINQNLRDALTKTQENIKHAACVFTGAFSKVARSWGGETHAGLMLTSQWRATSELLERVIHLSNRYIYA